LESYQTPEVQHLDNWTMLAQEAMWLLRSASEEVEKVREMAEIQFTESRQRRQIDPPQTRKGWERLILTFEQEKYLPKKCKKGRGREKGQKCEPRKRYQVVKKWGELVEIIKNRPQQE
jgi:hypothetical protein